MDERLSWYLVVIQCNFWRVTAKDVVSLQLLNLVFDPPALVSKKYETRFPHYCFHRWKLQNTFVSCPPWWRWWGCPGWRWHQEWASQRLRETSESPILLIEQPRQAVWTNTFCKLYKYNLQYLNTKVGKVYYDMKEGSSLSCRLIGLMDSW